ncbi:MAG: tetratricopeptide repeat protein [Vampirovibrionales bacterium]|nr:tetratricopeptide repeat protein [Vampirovibrionales bacterium]
MSVPRLKFFAPRCSAFRGYGFMPLAKSLSLSLAMMMLFDLGVSLFVPVEAARKYVPAGAAQEPPAPAPKAPEQNDTVQPPRVIVKTVRVPVRVPNRVKDPFVNLIDDHRFYEALRIVEQRLQKDPGNIGLQLSRAQVLRMDQEYQLAEEAYQQIFQHVKSKHLLAQAYYGFGMLRFNQAEQFRRLGDVKGQEALLSEASSIFKQSLNTRASMDAWAALANIQLLQGQLDESAESLKKASGYGANHLSVRLTKGYLALAQGKTEEASQEAFWIRHQRPDDPRALMLLGQAAMAEDRFDDAIIHFRQLSERLPENMEALHWLSKAYAQKNRLAEAEELLEKAVYINPFDWDAVQSLMTLYEREQNPQRSILLLKTMLSKLDTKEAKAQDNNESTSYPLYRIMLEQALLLRLNRTAQWEDAYALAENLLSHCDQWQQNASSFAPKYNAQKATLDLISAIESSAPLSPANTQAGDAVAIVNAVSLPTRSVEESENPTDNQRLSLASVCKDQEIPRIFLFAEAAYFSGKNLVDWANFYEQPLVSRTADNLALLLKQQPENPELRLAMAYLNPLANLPVLSEKLPEKMAAPNTFDTLVLRIQETFIIGDEVQYQNLLKQVASLPGVTPEHRYQLARRLYELGDLQSSRQIAESIPARTAAPLQSRLGALIESIDVQQQDRANMEKALKSLPDDEGSLLWHRVATQALQASPTDTDLRVEIARGLARQQRYAASGIQFRLAAQYEQNARKKKGLLKKARYVEQKSVSNIAAEKSSEKENRKLLNLRQRFNISDAVTLPLLVSQPIA